MEIFLIGRQSVADLCVHKSAARSIVRGYIGALKPDPPCFFPRNSFAALIPPTQITNYQSRNILCSQCDMNQVPDDMHNRCVHLLDPVDAVGRYNETVIRYFRMIG